MPMNDQQLITAASIQGGEREAFARLFEQNRSRLLALAYRLTSSAADAEDVVQEAFVSTLRHHDQFQGNSRPSTWLYRVTFNAALMRLRTRRRKGADSLDALPSTFAEKHVHSARALFHDEETPDELCDRRGTRKALDAALATLKPIDRTIVTLRFAEGLSTEEVAEATGLSQSAVKTRLHRARAALRDHLGGDAFAHTASSAAGSTGTSHAAAV
jgi:RNA polymerase sigma-70 factor (ECF subfamily)